MKNIAQALNIIKVLGELYPNAGCGLLFDTPFELLVATILSAQCTDDRVNQVTQSLFAKYRTPKDFARMSYDEFENHIKSCGLFRNKAKNIIDCAREIIEKYEGNVPQDIEHLQRMRGVGRKTANVVVSNAFNIPAIAVDTHVFRVARRIGLAGSSSVLGVELELQNLFERGQWIQLHHLLIEHGRKVCLALRPKCAVCELRQTCSFFEEISFRTSV